MRRETDERRNRGRLLLLSLFFLLWFLAAVFRALQIGWFSREYYRTAGEKIARYEGRIPARRGRILDRNGIALVWSEAYYDLFSELLPGETFSGDEEEQLLSLLSQPPDWNSPLLRAGLSPQELLALDPAISRGLRVRIQPRTERIFINMPELRTFLAEQEQKYNAKLAGADGKFQVFRDHYHRWIGSSWELLKPPSPGKDVYLKASLREMEGEL